MLLDRASNPGALTYESGALPIALRGPARGYGYIPLRFGGGGNVVSRMGTQQQIWSQEVEGSTPTVGTCANDFFRSNRFGYPHPVSSKLENSGIRVAVGDCSVTERRQ